MHNTMKNMTATMLLTASVVLSPALFAATPNDNTAQDGGDMGQMMQRQSQTGGMGMNQGDQMPMMTMMSQMNEMMATCNKMMQGQMDSSTHPKGSADKG